MDRGSGTLSKQMADFVIVCIIRQYTRASAKKSEKGEVTCGPSLYPPLISLPLCPHLLLFSIHLLKNTFPYVTEQENRRTGEEPSGPHDAFPHGISSYCAYSYNTRQLLRQLPRQLLYQCKVRLLELLRPLSCNLLAKE